jgi:hypothetical protein
MLQLREYSDKNAKEAALRFSGKNGKIKGDMEP